MILGIVVSGGAVDSRLVALAPLWMASVACVSLGAGLVIGMAITRRRMAERFRALTEVQVVPSRFIERGQTVSIDVPGGDRMITASGSVASLDPRYVAIAIDEMEQPIAVGTPMRVTVGLRTSGLRFDSIVVDRSNVNGIPTLFVERPKWVERIQRRQFYRVPVWTPTVVTARTGAGVQPTYRAVVQDLSARGVRLALPVKVEEGNVLHVRLPLDTLSSSGFDARVRRCEAIKSGDGMRYRVGCEFVALPEADMARLVAHCFDFQRAQLARIHREKMGLDESDEV